MPLQIALLTGTECLVKQNFRRTSLQGQLPDFFRLAGPHKQCGIRGTPLAHHTPHRLQARSLRQQAELFELCIKIGATQIDSHQNGRSQLTFRRIGQWEKNSQPERCI